MEENKETDYSKLGLKCGLEIHQQLDTSKLFCKCPSILRNDEPNYTIERELHAIAGESGEVDIAAEYEAKLGRKFFYQGYDTTCLVELDESPPSEINKEALKIVLQIAILLNCKIFPYTQIMRKIVIDGSNTSGFQRTVLIAKNGYVETEQGRIGIESICLEEDAARIIERTKEKVVYRLDRLGIPLIEIATSPDIKSPEQAKEVAMHIGNILRSCKVKRGIGTIRQDVNLSIKGHPRVELKGFQNMKILIRTIEKEIQRQKKNLSEKKLFSEVRKVLPDGNSEFLRPIPGSARMYPETDLPLLKIPKKLIDDVKKNLPKLRGDIEEELKEKGLNPEMIKLLFKQNKIEEFKELLDVLNNPKLIAKILLIFPKEISSHKKISKNKIEKILENNVFDILQLVKKGEISEFQIKLILENLIEGKNLREVVSKEEIDFSNIEEKILKIIKEKPGLSEKAYMGLVMKEFKEKINGKEAREIIKKYLK
jgi:Glu-tRNA(Gln) amidotransferase subunit E-like FAD-binding protein